MKKILILSPHFPPSNLAGVHRARLFAQHLPSFGWEPVIITVHEKYYEEKLDYNLEKLLPSQLRIAKVKAFSIRKPRLVGDIGLRAFFQLYRKAKELIQTESFDFLYIPIPSFYIALLGRWLHYSTGIKYGIDYIDPWVHRFPGSDQLFSRHWFSTQVARFLEPIAVKRATLITGVAEGYYKTVLERNPHLLKQAYFGAMPYGGEKSDHDAIRNVGNMEYLFDRKKEKLQLVYAGAMLPKSYTVLEAVFKVIQQEQLLFKKVEFHFIGTGRKANDPSTFTIKPLAEQYNLWQSVIFEYPLRIPYLEVLAHLDIADAVFILGSTEPHYTPSKVYQGILAGKPLFAILHQNSSASKVIKDANAGKVLTFNGIEDIASVCTNFTNMWEQFNDFYKSFNSEKVDMTIFDNYSARAVTKQLADLLNKAIGKK